VLAQGKLQLLAPHGWLKPKQKYIALQDLAGQSLIGLEGHDPLSRLLDAKLQALRPLPVVQTRVQTYPMMRGLVEAGEGLAIVDPFTAFGAQESGLDTCPLSPPIPVSLYALTLKNAASTPALNALLEIVAQKAQPLLAGSPAL
jgi:DNA-binding transcriptional LysR family regulator